MKVKSYHPKRRTDTVFENRIFGSRTEERRMDKNTHSTV
jgi:hypothetical protein